MLFDGWPVAPRQYPCLLNSNVPAGSGVGGVGGGGGVGAGVGTDGSVLKQTGPRKPR